jgi:hypothetical protein
MPIRTCNFCPNRPKSPSNGSAKRAARKRIKSVEYRLPADDAKRPRVTHHVESEYFLEGSMPNQNGVSMIAAIRWKSGETSTHTIPLRPRS